jgi:hypothetical protein
MRVASKAAGSDDIPAKVEIQPLCGRFRTPVFAGVTEGSSLPLAVLEALTVSARVAAVAHCPSRIVPHGL